MLPIESPERPVAKAPGRLGQALIRLLMKRATVTASERLARGFRLITLEGPALEGVAWTPGQKIQIAMGSAFTARTYTPIEWNPGTGRACILGHVHGDGPGSLWVRDAAPGDMCDIFGPRGSLDAGRMHGPLAVFGDETSIGLAHALAYQDPGRMVAGYFEVGDVEGSCRVAEQLGLDRVALFARAAGDAHVGEMEVRLATLAAGGTGFVLTGKAGTVQRLRQRLKRLAVPASRIAAKAYWAPGKTGLD
ncbi:hypothetical protein CAP40_08370 [Sphingomonas sp. IBVSS2]|uniref:siderophore-interacting protein n=1 Tax=Sphingomonas sp. IBVSS2 TaxID=1985172 RepID=UPI000A2D3227|nr:siderophore-interacting protein [Sphingomonas sp. IBVSS2]OSZ68575.1 hypothetical protein CAP40_08370 [Sphingomonas sp. IBVSS2]